MTAERVMGPLERAAIEYALSGHGDHPIERACLDEAFMRGAKWAGANSDGYDDAQARIAQLDAAVSRALAAQLAAERALADALRHVPSASAPRPHEPFREAWVARVEHAGEFALVVEWPGEPPYGRYWWVLCPAAATLHDDPPTEDEDPVTADDGACSLSPSCDFPELHALAHAAIRGRASTEPSRSTEGVRASFEAATSRSEESERPPVPGVK